MNRAMPAPVSISDEGAPPPAPSTAMPEPLAVLDTLVAAELCSPATWAGRVFVVLARPEGESDVVAACTTGAGPDSVCVAASRILTRVVMVAVVVWVMLATLMAAVAVEAVYTPGRDGGKGRRTCLDIRPRG